MASQYYTPFLAQAGANIGNALATRGQRERESELNELAGNAYMGDPQAMQDLAQLNPQLAQEIQMKLEKRQATAEQSQLNKEAARNERISQFKTDSESIQKNIAAYGSFEDAKAYGQQQIDYLKKQYPEIAEQFGDDVFDEEDFVQAKTMFGKSSTTKRDEVQSSKILPGGLVEMVFKSGKVEVVSPEEANILKIKEAEERGAELQGLRAGERGAATAAMKRAGEAFDKMVSVRDAISLYDQGIKLLDEGAGVGSIESKFPSFKAASVALDNVQANLGLNVIQNTTFGSLSESELNFALDTTMPQGLNTEELKAWMQKKRESQAKLADYLEEAATFLGTPGNTVADYLKYKKEQQKAEQQKAEQAEKPITDEEYEARKKKLGL